MEKRKPGRPKVEVPMSVSLGLRLSQADYLELLRLSDGRSYSKILREAVSIGLGVIGRSCDNCPFEGDPEDINNDIPY